MLIEKLIQFGDDFGFVNSMEEIGEQKNKNQESYL